MVIKAESIPEYQDHSFAALPAWVQQFGNFDPSCRLRLTPEAEAAGRSGALVLRLLRHGGPYFIGDVKVTVGAIRGLLTVTMADSGTLVDVGAGCWGDFNLKLWRNSWLAIGENTSANDIKIVLSDAEVRIGKDCMFSDEVLIQASDQHGLIDPTTLDVINGETRRVEIADHVWLGRRSTVMPDVRLGFGAVVGTGSVVTRDVPAMAIAAGVPARVVRSGTTWSRHPSGANEAEVAMIRAYQASQPEA